VNLTLSPGTGTVVPHPEKWLHEHVVYLYRESDAPLEGLCDYIGPALAGGYAAIVVATQAHHDRLEQRLMARGVSTYKAGQQGRYVALDDSEALSEIMLDGMPDGALFDFTIGGIISGARSFLKNGHSEISIFGEMVALWQPKAKSMRPSSWNNSGTTWRMKHSFSLRCAYPIANFSGDKNTQPLIRVCAEHSAVLFDEGASLRQPGCDGSADKQERNCHSTNHRPGKGHSTGRFGPSRARRVGATGITATVPLSAAKIELQPER
jgi:hypothetical protein